MAQFLSGRRTNLNIGVTSSTENSNVLNVIGNSNVSGVSTADSFVGTGLSISGISTFRNGPVLIGAATSTGIELQRLQVDGSAYVSGNTTNGVGIGIGVSNPQYPLDIRLNGLTSSTNSITIAPISGSYAAGILYANSSSSDFYTGLTNNLGVLGIGGISVQTPYAAVVGLTLGTTPLLFVTNNVERVRVFHTGEVGINTTVLTGTANQPLQVNGDASINKLTIGRGGGNISGNTALGDRALLFNTSGQSNTATGIAALYKNTTGNSNTATGDGALYNNDIGSYNAAFGLYSQYYNITGNNNTTIGNNSLYLNTAGSRNTAIGCETLYWNTAGSDNIAIGYETLYNNAIGSNNIGIGNSSGISTSASNKIIIGSGYDYISAPFDSPDPDKDYQFAVGIRTDDYEDTQYWLVGNENFNIGIGTTNPTSKLSVGGDISISGLTTTNDLYVSKIASLNAISAGGTTGISQYVLTSTGTGLIWQSLTSPIPGVSGFNVAEDATAGLKYLGMQVGAGTTQVTHISSNELVYNSNTKNLGIGTINPISKLTVQGDVKVSGVVTATEFHGILSGYASTAGIATYATDAGISTYATKAGIATNIEGGAKNSIPYQTGVNTTGFIAYGNPGEILTTDGADNAPYWAPLNVGSVVGQITVKDEGDIVGSAQSITQLDFRGVNIVAIANTGGNIATITVADYVSISGYSSNAGIATNVIGGIASVSSLFVNTNGISTLGTVKISSGIVTASSPSGIVTYYGEFVGDVTGYASYASSSGIATNVIGGIASVSSLFVNTTGISTLGTVKISSGIVTASSPSGIVTYYGEFVGNISNLAGGDIGNIPYQNSTGITSFLINGPGGSLLQSNGIGATPSWSSPQGLTIGYAATAGIATFATKAGIATYTSEWILGAVGSSNYTFTGPGLIDDESDPILYLIRGQQYKFTNTMGAHPFRIQSTPNGSTGTQYDDGITNNNVSNGTLTWNVQFDAPGLLYYQCTAHGGMGGKIYIIDAGIGPDISINTSGIITASTFVGTALSISGISTLGTVKISSGIVTASSPSGVVTYYGDGSKLNNIITGTATTATNLADGTTGNVPYQSSTGITTFVTNPGVSGKVLLFDFDSSVPVWGDVSLSGDVSAATSVRSVSANVTQYPTFVSGTGSTAFVGINKNLLTFIPFNNGSLGIGTTSPITNLHVIGSGRFTGSVTAGSFVGAGLSIFSGISTLGTVKISSGIVTATTTSGVVTYYGDGSKLTGVIAGTATTATNLANGAQGSLPYQFSSGITSFLPAASTNNQILLYNTTTNKPYWGAVSSGTGNGITVRDEGTTTLTDITTVDIFGSNITAIYGGSGIASIRVSDNLVGTALSISGISTLGTVKIVSGIVTSTTPTGVVTYYGDGSKLSNIISGVSISTNTTNQAQYLTYVAGIGTTTGFSVDPSGIVFNPSTNSLGIGITNPLKNLHVLGNLLVAGGGDAYQHITQTAYELNSGTLSWEGSAGQLFSITNNLTSGSIFSVNDVSGIPSIDVDANGIVSLGAYGGNIGIGTTLPTSKLTVRGDVLVSGASTLGTVQISSGIVTATTTSGVVTYYGDGSKLTGVAAGTATTATDLADGAQGSLPYQDAPGSTVFLSAPASTNQVLLYSNGTNQPVWSKVGLGTNTTGNYVKSISGNANEIDVTGGTGEGSTPTVGFANSPIIQGTLQINTNLNVNGNITVGGTTAFIAVNELRVKDKDIILGLTTNASNQDISTDFTANHGGIAIASTEGSPLIDINAGVGSDTIPTTYKQIVWLKSGSWTGLGTDAWLFNYGVGIGSTQFPTGTRLAVGGIQFTQNDIPSVRDINSSGIITATKFDGPLDATSALSQRVGFATTATNLANGAAGNVPYQSSTGITTFVTNPGVSGKVLLFNGSIPIWSDVSAATGSFGGISVQDETNPVGTANSITTLNFVGANILATATTGANGIATITIADNLVGTALSISGISTFTNGPVLIGAGTSTGTASQRLQVTGSAYVSDDVGIGTTNPTTKLDVDGDIRLRSGLYDSNNFIGDLNSILVSTGSSVTWSSLGDLGGSDITIQVDESTPEPQYLVFTNVTSGSSYTEKVSPTKLTYIASSGNLGIGTSIPSTPLSVERYGVKTGFGTFVASAGITTDVDNFLISDTDFKTAEYTIHIQSSSSVQAQKVLVMQNGLSAFSQEYAIMYDPTFMVSIGATVSGGRCKLQFTPESGISGLMTYRFTRETMK